MTLLWQMEYAKTRIVYLLSISIENTLCGIVLILLINITIFSSFVFLLSIYTNNAIE